MGTPVTHCVPKDTSCIEISHSHIYVLTIDHKNIKGDAILPFIPGAPLMIAQNIDRRMSKLADTTYVWSTVRSCSSTVSQRAHRETMSSIGCRHIGWSSCTQPRRTDFHPSVVPIETARSRDNRGHGSGLSIDRSFVNRSHTSFSTNCDGRRKWLRRPRVYNYPIEITDV